MRQVRLSRRTGQNPAGSIRTYSDSEAAWLVNGGFGAYVNEPPTAEQTAPAAVVAHVEQAPDAAPAPTLAELQTRAKDYGLPTYGTKAQLADRIEEHEQRLAAAADGDEAEDEDDEDDDE